MPVRVALAALCCVVTILMWRQPSVGEAIAVAQKPIIGGSKGGESVVIRDLSKHPNCSFGRGDRGNLGIIDAQHVVVMFPFSSRRQNPTPEVFWNISRGPFIEVQWIIMNMSPDPKCHFVGWRLSEVFYFDFDPKLMRRREPDNPRFADIDVSSQLAFSGVFHDLRGPVGGTGCRPSCSRTFFRGFRNLKISLEADAGGGGYVFHGLCGASGLRDGFRHLGRLALINLFHGADGLLQSDRLQTKNKYLHNSNHDQQGRKEGQRPIGGGNDLGPGPPIWRRFFLALVGAVGGFGLYFRGINDFDRQRRFFGAALVFMAFVWVIGGLGLLWLTIFSDTWGWWI